MQDGLCGCWICCAGAADLFVLLPGICPLSCTALQDKDIELGCARQEAAAASEEASAWQRRCKGLQGEADEREVELARRDLRAKARQGWWALIEVDKGGGSAFTNKHAGGRWVLG